MTGAELAEQVKSNAQIQRVKDKKDLSILIKLREGAAGRNDTKIDSLSGFFTGNPFPSLFALAIEAPISSITTDDFANAPKTLHTLQISSKTLTSIPAFHKNLAGLKCLSLVDNQLATISDSTFKNLKNLHSLWLNENKLTRIGDKLFTGLSNLELLNMEHNQIDFLHEKAFVRLTKLKTLILSKNAIKEMNYVAQPIGLETLILSHNPLVYVQISKLGKLIELKNLELEAVNPHLDTTILKEPFTAISPLESLNLKNCQIRSVDHLKVLERIFPKLKKIDLRENPELNSLGIVDMASVKRKARLWCSP